MGQKEKRIARLKEIPKDYTYDECRTLLKSIGFREFNQGSTSGSRVSFYRELDGAKIMLHKPHPGNTMRVAAVKEVFNFLMELGDLR